MKLNMRKILSNLLVASLIFFGTASSGVCQSDPVSISKGEAAPFSGLLFSEDKANGIRKELLEFDKTTILLETERNRTDRLGQIIQLKDKEIDLYQKQNDRLLRSNDRSDTLNYIWFGLGVLVTGAAVYGAGTLSR